MLVAMHTRYGALIALPNTIRFRLFFYALRQLDLIIVFHITQYTHTYAFVINMLPDLLWHIHPKTITLADMYHIW